MWFFCLPSFIAILVIGFIQVWNELYDNRETEATDPEETAVLVPIEVEYERGGLHAAASEAIEGL
jgi:hypothetical protein